MGKFCHSVWKNNDTRSFSPHLKERIAVWQWSSTVSRVSSAFTSRRQSFWAPSVTISQRKKSAFIWSLSRLILVWLHSDLQVAELFCDDARLSPITCYHLRFMSSSTLSSWSLAGFAVVGCSCARQDATLEAASTSGWHHYKKNPLSLAF